MHKLDEIIAWKRKEIASVIRPVKERELARFSEMGDRALSFVDVLSSNDELSIIGEIKKRSPSAGVIVETVDVVDQARKYVNAEIDAISVLTDEEYFGGKMEYLWDVVDFVACHNRKTPCLRKDFMVHPVQVVEAAEAGAMAILIIVTALNDEEIKVLYDSANIAGMDSIFEVHTMSELDRAMKFNPQIVGVNNRDLKRFVTDLKISETIIPEIPDDIIKISESGISCVDDAITVREFGADAALIGEALMRSDDVDGFVEAIKEAG